ncbi:MAG TPA: glycosyltransferase family 39 protein [Solirubrobacteraceae bacterium]|jgi:4-amino-4-deoxy-L-arabinose transferase-like glycosyltransferase|nr:glycosyltransferase family 39 protein [Solirubrobacteraceae bacterium]
MSKSPWRLLALALITALAAALRLVDLGAVRVDPFYDAAVRSMGVSWHNFFFGAYEPGGSVSIDKPPIDLWLEVASVKLFGWGSVSLKLPEALAGTVAVPLLYAAVRRPFGALAGLVAALALAVLPIEVVTARSDTMDAVMMLLLVLALLLLVRACESERRSTAWLLGAAAALGVAFDVKLLESLIALPGLTLIALLGLPRAGAQRTGEEGRSNEDAGLGSQTNGHGSTWGRVAFQLLAAAVVYAVVALSWLGATLLYPARERPWAIGSSNGSAWNAAFVFNGSERISGKAVEVAQAHGSSAIAPPSPTRLLASSGGLPGNWLGWVALTALLLGTFAVVVLARRGRAARVRRAVTVGVFVWLLTGLVLFSQMARLHPRYVESFVPAVAATFGIGVGLIAAARSPVRWLALALTALLAWPLAVSVEAVQSSASDAGNVGALAPSEQHALSSYLLAHRNGARYELAAGSATAVASLIVADRLPVLMLTTYDGRPLTSADQLRRAAHRQEVRYAFLSSLCGVYPRPTNAGCAPAALWVQAHGSDVSQRAGLRPRTLWRLP